MDRTAHLRRERRSEDKYSYTEGRTPGIERLKALIERAIDDHDHRWEEEDSKVWLSHYSLRNHHKRVAETIVAMGMSRGCTDTELALRAAAGGLHDVGKTNHTCYLYRLNRKLSKKEKKLVAEHAKYSATALRSYLPQVRPEDRRFIRWISTMVRWHHKPWFIVTPWLREQTWDLFVADIFVALTEDRHRPGIPKHESAEVVSALVRHIIPHPIQILFNKEINASLSLIKTLYGKP